MEFNGTFFATIITFVVFVFLMNKILYAPILSIMQQREDFIDDNYKNAEENNIKCNELSCEKEQKLSDAKNEAKNEYLNEVNSYKVKKAEIIEQAQGEANQNYENMSAELVNVSNFAKESLKGRMSELANDIVEKVIGYRTEYNDFDASKVDEVLYK